MKRSESPRRLMPAAFGVVAGLLVWMPLAAPSLAGAGPQEKGGTAPATAAVAAPAADAHAADRAAIAATLRSVVKAYQAKDAKALAALWTAEGEFTNDAGLTVRGRENLAKAFTKAFAVASEQSAVVEPGPVRFLASGLAMAEGTVTVRRGAAAPPRRANYQALLAREGEAWLLAIFTETPEGAPTLNDLAWLVGEWRSTTGQGAEIRTTYSWSPGKKFLRSEFTIREKEIALSGFQVIGVDPETGLLHTWTFEADGGVGEADWQRDGDQWALSAVGTLSGGRTVRETNVLTRVNDDTFTWQSVDRTVGDKDVPDLAPVKVTRVKPSN